MDFHMIKRNQRKNKLYPTTFYSKTRWKLGMWYQAMEENKLKYGTSKVKNCWNMVQSRHQQLFQ